MRVLILGGAGMLGHKLTQSLKEDFDVSATFRGRIEDYRDSPVFAGANLIPGIDAENFEILARTIDEVEPDAVINAIGVIKQLPTAKDVVKVLTINSILPHRLAQLAFERNFRLINISTDCVFRGDRGDYNETDEPDATDLYGKSKNLGEATGENCLTLRTSIIGRELATHHSLVEWFLAQTGKKIKGYRRAIYTGFPTVVFARVLAGILIEHPNLTGLYHVSSGKISKYELLEMVNQEFKAGVEIEADEDFVLDRSLDSKAFRRSTGFEPPEWGEMIGLMAEDAAGIYPYKQ